MTKILFRNKIFIICFALYLTFILLSMVPYIAEHEISRGKITAGVYESHLVFPEDGQYGHYESVILKDKAKTGKIDLRYVYETHTLHVDNVENIKELVIDSQLMYQNKYKEVLGSNPAFSNPDYYKTYFEETNNGEFTVIIDTDTPMDKLQILDVPLPNKVLVNYLAIEEDWWNNQTQYYTKFGNDIVIDYIPEGSTTVSFYFQKEGMGKNPNAYFTASKYVALANEDISFNATGSFDEEGYIVDFIWDWGDGVKVSGKIMKYSYSKLGNYIVTLTVRDNDNLGDTFSRNISIVQSDTDTDGDGVPDLTDPNPEIKLDTDGDGLYDDFETVISKSDVNKKDTDNDGWDDDIEYEKGTDPNNRKSYPAEKKDPGQDGLDAAAITSLGAIAAIVIILIIIILLLLKKRKKGEGSEEEEIPTKKPSDQQLDHGAAPKTHYTHTVPEAPETMTLERKLHVKQPSLSPSPVMHPTTKPSTTTPHVFLPPEDDSGEVPNTQFNQLGYLSDVKKPEKTGAVKEPAIMKPSKIKGIKSKRNPKEDTIQLYILMIGINKPVATAIYDAGYTSLLKLEKANEKDVMKIKGIGPKIAKQIKKTFK